MFGMSIDSTIALCGRHLRRFAARFGDDDPQTYAEKERISPPRALIAHRAKGIAFSPSNMRHALCPLR
jgi:hypothetical protein